MKKICQIMNRERVTEDDIKKRINIIAEMLKIEDE